MGLSDSASGCYRDQPRGCTADGLQLLAVFVHHGVVLEQLHRGIEDRLCVRVDRFADAVMHPLAIAAARNKRGPFEIGQMARDLWIIRSKRLGKKTNADLTSAHQVQQTQPRPVRKGRKKQLRIETIPTRHEKNYSILHLWLDIIVWSIYSLEYNYGYA